ncbi:hypothetical protein Agub_g15316 [Astrephomene gubernaculifera]|uniref:Amine oxidase domain-containing protein n=1 Tax=Astrephomene gubernaculifera TaxID=47775 RepID=A0AAD3E2V3_9CHLO|nr:hypothetical protein Agub_g15316 [Astrephomene gubernaculifera]
MQSTRSRLPTPPACGSLQPTGHYNHVRNPVASRFAQSRAQASSSSRSRISSIRRKPPQDARSLATPVMAAAAAESGGESLAFSSSTSSSIIGSGGGAEGRRVVIVGGGWAGFGAAKHLAEQGCDVTLLEAAAHPGGLSGGFRTTGGRAVEAGMKGFWYQYHNIFALLRELRLPAWPLTEWTPSGFWGAGGKLLTEAPVFSSRPRLPTLLGQFVHTFPLYWSLPLPDRLTLLPFLATLADYVSSEEVYEQYDKMSAYELFRRCGVSARAYDEFLRPTLLVGLFAPPEELSAAVVLDTLYFYALAHQNDFDVCWPRGSVAELVFMPLVERIRAAGGRVLGSRLVTGFSTDPESGEVRSVEAVNRDTGEVFSYPTDAVVFAVGVGAMQKLVSSSPALASQPDFCALMQLRSLDVVATRLWFDRRLPTRYPANVLSGLEPSAGATFFNLNELQDEYRDAAGTVLSADIYHAASLLPLSDEQLVQRLLAAVRACEPGFKVARLVDSVVLRYPRAVTHFSPGSHRHRPTQTTSIPNVFMAGDWVKGLPHGANGLSQERAYVTGLSASNLVIARLHGSTSSSSGWDPKLAVILDVEPDEPHVAAARAAARGFRDLASAVGLRSPLL